MLQLAVLAFNGLSLTTKLIAIASVLAAIGITGGVIYANIYNKGYDKALRDVAAQNERAISTATKYRAQSRECDDRGMRWRTSTGQCE
jgi:hypothetical protein